MIIEEGTVIILGNNARYYLAHEIGKLEGYGDNMYYFAVGVTPRDTLNTKDIIFLEIAEIDNQPTATRVAEDTDLYSLLRALEITKVLMDTIPGYEDKVISDLEKLDRLEKAKESSN